MSAAALLDDVSHALRERLPDLPGIRYEIEGAVVIVVPTDPILAYTHAEWCRRIAEMLSAQGYHCSRSRTRVRVTRVAPPPLEEPDFVCRRNRA